MIKTKKVLFLNDTENCYHHGCNGTSYAIKQKLRENNFVVESITTLEYQTATDCVVEKLDDFDSDSFFQKWKTRYSSFLEKMTEHDVILINGEGTLHNVNYVVLFLLYYAYIAKTKYNKNVQIINHSCFPDDCVIVENAFNLSIYKKVYAVLDTIVVRDSYSYKIVKEQMGLNNVFLGFDSLCLYIETYFKKQETILPKNEYILITGGVSIFNRNFTKIYIEIIKILENLFGNTPIYFLLGEEKTTPPDDITLLKNLNRKRKICNFFSKEKFDINGINKIKNLNLIRANNIDEWLSIIQNAKFLISGRFHHSIAAFFLSIPFILFESNTPKTLFISETLNNNNPITSKSKCYKDVLRQFSDRVANIKIVDNQALKQDLIKKAKLNLIGVLGRDKIN
jgi:polysaccharide pyruvyl transferase WcaK-like protein